MDGEVHHEVGQGPQIGWGNNEVWGQMDHLEGRLHHLEGCMYAELKTVDENIERVQGNSSKASLDAQKKQKKMPSRRGWTKFFMKWILVCKP